MTKHSKRFREGQAVLGAAGVYSFEEAVAKLQAFPKAKFDESVELAIKLGIDPRQADQAIRGAYSMPHGLGKKSRVIAFVDDSLIEEAKAAGAVEAGGKELADKIKDESWFEFDVAIAEPKMMRVVGLLGRVLGPKGLMPSPKAGTVVANPIDAIREFVAGKQEYKNDSAGNIHMVAGKVSFDTAKLVENIQSFFHHIQSIKPSGAKGQYIQRVVVSSTMGPGINIAFQK